MERYPASSEMGKDRETNKALKSSERKLNSLTKDIKPEKYPSTDSFGGVRLSKTGIYNNIPGNPERLKRTGRSCATNPTYENSLVITQGGKPQRITHRETYYTARSFPVENIEWRIRSILNSDRKRNGMGEISKSQKVRNEGVDGTIRDMNGYIVVAADLKRFPRGTLIMTTLGPGRVYDVGGKVNGNHIDVFTNWEK